MKILKDVTLFALTSIEIDATIWWLLKSSEQIEFAEIKLLSDKKPDNLPEKIKWEYVPKMSCIDDFNYYMFLETGKHIETSHAICQHHHSGILCPELWNDNWLKRDYIGCIWPVVENAYLTDENERVRQGNGGFSLRSKKLMDAPKKLGLKLEQRQGWYNEDGNICVYHRKKLLEYGVQYGTIEEAAVFGYENLVPENVGIESFGYHRNFPSWGVKYILKEPK